MANGQSDLERAQTINSLYRKAMSLSNEAQALDAAGPHQPNPALFQQRSAAARQEAYYCSAKAQALTAGNNFTYPGQATIQQVALDCQTLEQAIATSAGWAAVIAAGDTLIHTMPSTSI
jgi:hypothetical protein